jgi:hypothetical protein
VHETAILGEKQDKNGYNSHSSVRNTAILTALLFFDKMALF